jgi:putative copper export protein/methionine-rich copper-binding protein CopC
MHNRYAMALLRRAPCLRLLLAVALLLGTASAVHAHIRLERSNPGRDEVVAALPPELQLEFSGRIEERYTSIALTAPDGSPVAIGRVVFAPGSDRIVTLQLPPLVEPGVYAVTWRTAGADGHVLEGSFSFVLAHDGSADDTVTDTVSAIPPAAHEHHAHDEPESVGGTRDAVGRGLHFAALLLLTGAVAFRVLLVPRLSLAHDAAHQLRRRAWHITSVAAVLLAGAAVFRLWLQSVALHGEERAWSTPLLSIMLRDTAWGRAWVLQVFLFAVLGAAIAWARPHRDRMAAAIAVLATLGLCAVPATSGHAAGATGGGWLVVVNDAAHVAAAGAWLGTLGVLLIAALPVLLRQPDGRHVTWRAVDAFSPVALGMAAVVVATGTINVLLHLTAPEQLWATVYGRTLMVKLGMVAIVLLIGFVNWRVVRPRLRLMGDVGRFRLTASFEVLFALMVLAATAVLTGQPRP